MKRILIEFRWHYHYTALHLICCEDWMWSLNEYEVCTFKKVWQIWINFCNFWQQSKAGVSCVPCKRRKGRHVSEESLLHGTGYSPWRHWLHGLMNDWVPLAKQLISNQTPTFASRLASKNVHNTEVHFSGFFFFSKSIFVNFVKSFQIVQFVTQTMNDHLCMKVTRLKCQEDEK